VHLRALGCCSCCLCHLPRLLLLLWARRHGSVSCSADAHTMALHAAEQHITQTWSASPTTACLHNGLREKLKQQRRSQPNPGQDCNTAGMHTRQRQSGVFAAHLCRRRTLHWPLDQHHLHQQLPSPHQAPAHLNNAIHQTCSVPVDDACYASTLAQPADRVLSTTAQLTAVMTQGTHGAGC
jgi:hypothetical protein